MFSGLVEGKIYSRRRFCKAVNYVFVSLYNEGLIYRDYYLVNRCPRCQTVLSDIEIEHQEVKGHLWYIRYPLPDSSEELVVATTRPETMLGRYSRSCSSR